MSLEDRLEYVAMKARHKNLLLPWYKKWWGVLILAVAGLILAGLIAAGIYVVNKIQEIRSGNLATSEEEQWQNYLSAIYGDGSNYYAGLASSSITIVEFADFACPYCLSSKQATQELRSKYPNKVKLIYRDYPLHDNSIDLALAARCAGEQNKFWEMHDLIFDNQDVLSTATTTDNELKNNLLNLASDLKLVVSQFETCLDNRLYIPAIKKDYEDGELLKIEGTPTWFVNGYQITGSLDSETLKGMVEGLIN